MLFLHVVTFSCSINCLIDVLLLSWLVTNNAFANNITTDNITTLLTTSYANDTQTNTPYYVASTEVTENISNTESHSIAMSTLFPTTLTTTQKPSSTEIQHPTATAATNSCSVLYANQTKDTVSWDYHKGPTCYRIMPQQPGSLAVFEVTFLTSNYQDISISVQSASGEKFYGYDRFQPPVPTMVQPSRSLAVSNATSYIEIQRVISNSVARGEVQFSYNVYPSNRDITLLDGISIEAEAIANDLFAPNYPSSYPQGIMIFYTISSSSDQILLNIPMSSEWNNGTMLEVFDGDDKFAPCVYSSDQHCNIYQQSGSSNYALCSSGSHVLIKFISSTTPAVFDSRYDRLLNYQSFDCSDYNNPQDEGSDVTLSGLAVACYVVLSMIILCFVVICAKFWWMRMKHQNSATVDPWHGRSRSIEYTTYGGFPVSNSDALLEDMIAPLPTYDEALVLPKLELVASPQITENTNTTTSSPSEPPPYMEASEPIVA